MKWIFTFYLCGLSAFLMAQQSTYLLAGTYTDGKSKGIYVYRFLPDGSAMAVDSVETPNPSFLAVSPNSHFVYAVNENGAAEGGGKVSAYRFDKGTGKMALLNQVSAEGEHPCYITVDKTGRWVIVGNYTSGNVTVLPVQKDGSLGQAVTTVQHFGKSVHSRQEAPHVHATVLSKNNRFLYVPDLGIDKLMIYAFDAKTGSLTPKDTTMIMTAGSGPRHFDFHPTAKWAYLLQELTGTVTAFREKNGFLRPQQSISVLPIDFKKPFTSADIHVSSNGKFLYTSTRDEANLLSIFSIHPVTGKLTLKGHQSTKGRTPRNFTLDPSGKFLLSANQRTNEVVIFKVNPSTGNLTDSGKRIAIDSPVNLTWITN